MASILDHAPELVDQSFTGETWLTRRWSHGELHDSLPGLDSHVIMTYYGTATRDIVWRIGGQRLGGRTRAGTMTVIPAGHDGRWDIDGDLEVSHLYLPDSRLQAAAQELNRGRPVELLGRLAVHDVAGARLLEMLSGEGAPSDPASRLFVEQAIDLLSIQLIRGHSSIGTLATPVPRRGLAEWQVRKVTAYMREHLDQEIGLDELASMLSLSRFYFGTAFRLATGQTPHDWLVRERMERATLLLRDPELPVTQVALAVGYQTPSSFAAAFRRIIGVPPTEYRRML